VLYGQPQATATSRRLVTHEGRRDHHLPWVTPHNTKLQGSKSIPCGRCGFAGVHHWRRPARTHKAVPRGFVLLQHEKTLGMPDITDPRADEASTYDVEQKRESLTWNGNFEASRARRKHTSRMAVSLDDSAKPYCLCPAVPQHFGTPCATRVA